MGNNRGRRFPFGPLPSQSNRRPGVLRDTWPVHPGKPGPRYNGEPPYKPSFKNLAYMPGALGPGWPSRGRLMVLLMEESTPFCCRIPCIRMWSSGQMSWAVQKISCQALRYFLQSNDCAALCHLAHEFTGIKSLSTATRSKCRLTMSRRSLSITCLVMTI